MSRHAAAAAVRTMAPAGLAALAFALLALSPAGWIGYGLVCLALVVSWTANRPPALGTDVPARVVLAAAVLVPAAGVRPAAWPVAAGVLLLGLLLLEGLLQQVARPWFQAAHLPVRPPAAAAAVSNGTAWGVNSAAVALVGLAALLDGPGWLLLAPAVAAAGFAGWLAFDGGRRWRTGHRAELARLTRQVEQHQPRFLLYFSAPPGSEYQARMWLPYLPRLGGPFVVVLPERHNLAPISAATSAPVIVYETFEALDAIMVPSLRAAFYVNNGMKNAHCVRFTHITHIQLYHGDSDKAVTASPLNAMYDRIFVAGQAAVDRFAHYGVSIPREKFSLVGRPQVAELQVTGEPIGKIEDKVVLYAPTWAGVYADSNYCSLPIAEKIIQGLLDRGGTVILRAHPYSERDRRSAEHLRRAQQLLARDRARTGKDHRWGKEASGPSLFDCMNTAHAMICDVSAVASDFLYTGKPFAITDMLGAGDSFTDEFPAAKAAYVLARDAGNLPEVLADLLDHDPAAATRWELRTYYLGDRGDRPPDQYAELFLTEARRYLQ